MVVVPLFSSSFHSFMLLCGSVLLFQELRSPSLVEEQEVEEAGQLQRLSLRNSWWAATATPRWLSWTPSSARPPRPRPPAVTTPAAPPRGEPWSQFLKTHASAMSIQHLDLSVCLSVSLSVILSVYQSISICLAIAVYIYIYIMIYLSVDLVIHLSVCLSICVYHSVYVAMIMML